MKPSQRILRVFLYAFIGIALVFGTLGGVAVWRHFHQAPDTEDEEDEVEKEEPAKESASIILYEVNEADPSQDDMKVVKAYLQTELDEWGYYDTSVSLIGDNQVQVKVPPEFDAEEVADAIKTECELTFTDYDGNVVLDGDDVADAQYVYGQVNENSDPQHHVRLTLKSSGQQKFAKATQEASMRGNGVNIININIDDETISSPSVSETINSNQCVITGNFTKENAQCLVSQIRFGKLPFSLSLVSITQD